MCLASVGRVRNELKIYTLLQLFLDELHYVYFQKIKVIKKKSPLHIEGRAKYQYKIIPLLYTD
jgi:hypothetical protein